MASEYIENTVKALCSFTEPGTCRMKITSLREYDYINLMDCLRNEQNRSDKKYKTINRMRFVAQHSSEIHNEKYIYTFKSKSIKKVRENTKALVNTYKDKESSAVLNLFNSGEINSKKVKFSYHKSYEKLTKSVNLDKIFIGKNTTMSTPLLSTSTIKENKNNVELNREDENQILFRLLEDNGLELNVKRNKIKIEMVARVVRENKKLYMIPRVNPPRYEVEISMFCNTLTSKKSIAAAYDILKRNISFILRSLLEQPQLVMMDAAVSLINYVNKVKSSDTLRKPRTLDLENALNYVNNQYAATAKADGERMLCVIYEDIAYLVSPNFHVRIFKHLKQSNLNGTILDGEFMWHEVYKKFIFIAFDILIYAGEDLTKPSLKNNFLLDRLKLLDKVIIALDYPVLYHKEFPQVSSKDYVTEYTKQLESIMGLNKKVLTSSKQHIVILRKFYAFPEGYENAKDNDIYKLIHMLWQFYQNTSLWKIDGIILTPIHQIYNPIVSVKGMSSVLAEWKLKPNDDKNRLMTIDFKVVIESIKNTGRPLPIYDHTQSKKPYNVGHLHVVNYNQKHLPDHEKETVEFRKEYEGNIVYLPIDPISCLPKAQDGNIIRSGHVVEFQWKQDSKYTKENWFKPLRVRYDKTVGNGITNALNIYNLVTNPNKQLTFDDVEQLSLDKDNQKTRQSLYERMYQGSMPTTKDVGIKKVYTNFVTAYQYVIENLIIKSCYPSYNSKLIAKKVLNLNEKSSRNITYFLQAKITEIVNILPKNFKTLKDAFEKISEKEQTNIKLHYLQGDTKKPLTYAVQTKAYKFSIPEIKAYKHIMKKKNDFNVICCLNEYDKHFSTHAEITSLINTVTEHLCKGGYFITAHIDAMELLKEMDSNNNVSYNYTDSDGMKQNLISMHIKNTQNEITVGCSYEYNNHINKTKETRYLINHEYVTLLLEERGIQCYETCMFSDFIAKHHNNFKILNRFNAFFNDLKNNIKTQHLNNFVSDNSTYGDILKQYMKLFRFSVYIYMCPYLNEN